MTEARPNVHRRRLGSALRSLRVAAGFGMEEAAEQLGLSGKPPLSKIENGKQRVSGLGLTAFFQVYGVQEEATKAKIKTMAALAASGKRTNFLLAEYKESIRMQGFEEYLNLEGMASSVENYLHIIPGLLQTREYAMSIVEGSQAWATKREASRFVDLRMARQAVLTREDPLGLDCILDEAALRRVVGGPEVMRGQLDSLLAVEEEHQNVSVRVLPFDAGAHSATDGSFQLLYFAAGPPVALVETKATSVYLEEDADVDRYRTAFDDLRAKALDVQATRRLLHRLSKDCYT